MRLTHASFFSGVGGLDLGLERAGWRTVSFSEIDPYANAVLASRWPGVPNLGSITDLAAGSERLAGDARRRNGPDGVDWTAATLWSGGFPCQDLSVAGKRAGLAGERSGLAFAFLDLVERHRPRWILLENVPGLLSSHGGADLAALACRVADLGYGMAYRVLDARHYGVPQRRRRVFILATNAPGGRAGAERAAEVLALAASGGRHPAAGGEAGPGAAPGARLGVDYVGPLDTAPGHHGAAWPDQSVHSGRLFGASPDPGGVRAADGLAGRLDDPDELAPTLTSPIVKEGGRRDRLPVTVQSLDTKRGGPDDNEAQAGHLVSSQPGPDDPLLPIGLDSHRYRVIGNGVVANVAEEIGRALRYVIERVA